MTEKSWYDKLFESIREEYVLRKDEKDFKIHEEDIILSQEARNRFFVTLQALLDDYVSTSLEELEEQLEIEQIFYCEPSKILVYLIGTSKYQVYYSVFYPFEWDMIENWKYLQ